MLQPPLLWRRDRRQFRAHRRARVARGFVPRRLSLLRFDGLLGGQNRTDGREGYDKTATYCYTVTTL